MTTTVTMWLGDVRKVLDWLIAEGRTYDLLVTSPPFWSLRAYLPGDHPDKGDEIGGEPTPGEFLDTLYALTDQFGRLIPEWGSICVELGDTMSGSGGAGGDYDEGGLREGQEAFVGSSQRTRDAAESRRGVDAKNRGNTSRGTPDGGPGIPLGKSMCLIPHSYTFGLVYGINPHTGQPTPAGQWRVRNVVNWARPNPPVGSLGKRNVHKRTGDQRFRYASSFITIACRGRDRYFDLDAVRVEPSANTHTRVPINGGAPRFDLPSQQREGNWSTLAANNDTNPAGSPPLDWHVDDLDGDWLWRLNTQGYPGSHYATFPLTLPRRLLLAMCPQRVCTQCGWPSERVTRNLNEGHGRNPWNGATNGEVGFGNRPNNAEYVTVGWTDCDCFAGFEDNFIQSQRDHWRRGHVLDPFGGSGTTAVAAALEGRDATLVDFDVRNVALVHGRLDESLHIIDCQADDQRVVWTVEAPLPKQKEQVGGQLNLLS